MVVYCRFAESRLLPSSDQDYCLLDVKLFQKEVQCPINPETLVAFVAYVVIFYSENKVPLQTVNDKVW